MPSRQTLRNVTLACALVIVPWGPGVIFVLSHAVSWPVQAAMSSAAMAVGIGAHVWTKRQVQRYAAAKAAQEPVSL